ncbi:MAG: STAS domain-containing protein [Planctomycetota bacterium]|nr:STAS domain-containing protein [Planctomycetota bacterium]
MNDADQIEVIKEVVDGTTILKPMGEIDLSRAPSLRNQISEVQSEGLDKLVIDLSNVPYMDSSGVATLVEAMQIARRGNTKIILCCMQERVLSIFEIARLDMVFTIVGSPEEAMTA